ncbi:hypothetical protein N656DRAFT_777272 [Canariomyces notabilis]|uniref:Uncharacterized protein n=1 Tax=Canariomyces notabilis TaxID=2074819 RepID=A0AAN6TGN8_9PEZI|nr:hypothetical protein N656DRAFT_777272 [Canariomyces arenarius]
MEYCVQNISSGPCVRSLIDYLSRWLPDGRRDPLLGWGLRLSHRFPPNPAQQAVIQPADVNS